MFSVYRCSDERTHGGPKSPDLLRWFIFCRLNGLEIMFRQIAVKDSLFRIYILHNLTQSNAAFNTHNLTLNISGS